MQILQPQIFANMMKKYRDFIGWNIHVTAVQPPLPCNDNIKVRKDRVLEYIVSFDFLLWRHKCTVYWL